MIGNADHPQDLYLACRAEQVGTPQADETAEVRSVPFDEASAMSAKGDILGAITAIGVQQALQRRAGAYVGREVPYGGDVGPEPEPPD